MSVFDLIILAILAALTLRGIWKGMISQIVSVVSFFVCWIVATRFGGLIAPTIPVEAPWNQVLAMAVIFLITLIAIRFAYTALEKLIKHWHLEKLNKLFGGLLGFTKGLLLCLIITFFAVMFSETSRAVVFNSKSGTLLVHFIARISMFVPADSYEFVHTQIAQFQNKVDEAVPDQAPETLRVHDTERVQKLLGQAKTSSLWTALSKWWNGESTSAPPVEHTKEAATAATYIPPSPLQGNTYNPQPVSPQPITAVQEFFVQRTEPLSQATSPQPLSASPPTLAPLTELLPMPTEQPLTPMPPQQYHVGSDLLLHNSEQPAKSSAAPAKVFRP